MASSGVAVETTSTINLKGSAEIIRDFMDFSINMILYQREVYGDAEFEKIEKYGRPLFMTTNEKLKQYLEGVLNGLQTSIENDECRKVVLVIIDTDTEEPVEHWEFEIEPEIAENSENNDPLKQDKERTVTKDIKKIQSQMMKIMKQIIGTVTYLPCREDAGLTFNILLYIKKRTGDKNMDHWEGTHGHELVVGAGECKEEIETLSFDTLKTGLQTVKSKVCYKVKNGV